MSFGTAAVIARRLLVGFHHVTLSVLVLPVSLALASHTFSSCDLFVVVRAVVCVFLCGPVMTGPVDGRTDRVSDDRIWLDVGLRRLPVWMLIK